MILNQIVFQLSSNSILFLYTTIPVDLCTAFRLFSFKKYKYYVNESRSIYMWMLNYST